MGILIRKRVREISIIQYRKGVKKGEDGFPNKESGILREEHPHIAQSALPPISAERSPPGQIAHWLKKLFHSNK